MQFIILLLFAIIIISILIIRKNNRKKTEQIDEAIDYSEDNKSVKIELSKKQIKYQDINIKLIRAGIPLEAREYIRIRYVSTLFIMIILFFLTKNYFLCLLFSILWYFVPPIIVKFSTERKKNLLEAQISPALSLIRNSLEAGMSFMQALEIVAEEMDPPIGEEFSRVLHETKLGKDISVALTNMLNRVQSQELKLVVIAVLIQKQVGGNLGEIIDIILETIEDRIKIKGQIKTLTSQGRLSAVIISCLPIILGLIMSLLNPVYMKPLFTTFIGQTLIGICIALMLIGVYMISKIVKIEF